MNIFFEVNFAVEYYASYSMFSSERGVLQARSSIGIIDVH